MGDPQRPRYPRHGTNRGIDLGALDPAHRRPTTSTRSARGASSSNCARPSRRASASPLDVGRHLFLAVHDGRRRRPSRAMLARAEQRSTSADEAKPLERLTAASLSLTF